MKYFIDEICFFGEGAVHVDFGHANDVGNIQRIRKNIYKVNETITSIDIENNAGDTTNSDYCQFYAT